MHYICLKVKEIHFPHNTWKLLVKALSWNRNMMHYQKQKMSKDDYELSIPTNAKVCTKVGDSTSIQWANLNNITLTINVGFLTECT